MFGLLANLITSIIVKEDTAVYHTPTKLNIDGVDCEMDNIPDPEDSYRGTDGILYKYNSNLEFDKDGNVVSGEWYNSCIY